MNKNESPNLGSEETTFCVPANEYQCLHIKGVNGLAKIIQCPITSHPSPQIFMKVFVFESLRQVFNLSRRLY
jgi:hypothetical protein